MRYHMFFSPNFKGRSYSKPCFHNIPRQSKDSNPDAKRDSAILLPPLYI